MSNESSGFAGLRRPEYTGSNRCLPCTVVNLVFAGVASLVAALIAVQLAIAVFAVSLLAIYFRGYLIPGTPELTKRYLPDSVLARFDHAEEHPAASGGLASVSADDGSAVASGSDTDDSAAEADADGSAAGAHAVDDAGDDGSDADDAEESGADDHEWETLKKIEEHERNEVDPEQFLRENGVIEDGDADELVLTDSFSERVAKRLDSLEIGALDDDLDDALGDALATLFAADPDEIEHVEREYPAIKVDARIRQWPSEAALLADAAAHLVLENSDAGWLDVPLEQRVGILESLRSFRETCPDCGGPVVGNESVVESCCRSFDVVTIACEDCEARLLEVPAHAADGVETPGGTLR